MDIRVAMPDEYKKVINFYYEMIDKMQSSEFHPTWKMGVYPTDDYLKELVLSGQLFLCLDGERIIGAMVINHDCNESYSKMSWEVDAAADEVTIIHLLCVLPEYGGRGLGKKMLSFAMAHAAEKNQKAIRLDVMEKNLPAIKLYDSMGFRRLETVCMFYESTGWTNFIIYEYEVQ